MAATFRELTDDQHANLMANLRARAARHERVQTYYGPDEYDCPHDDKTGEHERHFISWAGVGCYDLPAGYGCVECEQEDCELSTDFYWAREDFWSLQQADGAAWIREELVRAAIAGTDEAPDADTAAVAIHLPDACTGSRCIIHNPSPHPLVNAPMRWGGPLGMQRVCGHGFEHPDVDDAAHIVNKNAGINPFEHICDGCCKPAGR
jgi:hypothetical protein